MHELCKINQHLAYTIVSHKWFPREGRHKITLLCGITKFRVSYQFNLDYYFLPIASSTSYMCGKSCFAVKDRKYPTSSHKAVIYIEDDDIITRVIIWEAVFEPFAPLCVRRARARLWCLYAGEGNWQPSLSGRTSIHTLTIRDGSVSTSHEKKRKSSQHYYRNMRCYQLVVSSIMHMCHKNFEWYNNNMREGEKHSRSSL